jgi:hypothetical protein
MEGNNTPTGESLMSEVPGLAYEGGITAEDIPTPWVLLAQGQTQADVEYGSIYTNLGSQSKQIAKQGEPVRFHVLRGPIKRWGIITTENDKWFNDDYAVLAERTDIKPFSNGDPGVPTLAYEYVIALPEVDERLPYKIRFFRSAVRAAKEINMALLFAGPGNESSVAFDLTTVKGEGDYKYVVPSVRQVEVPALEAAKTEEKLAVLRPLAGAVPVREQIAATTTDAPALD